MKQTLLCLKRPWIWLCRFRHRRGYGVHSPYAFDYITRVIYEEGMYYKYKDLAEKQRLLTPVKGKEWARQESRKLKRLLFRMVNYARPDMLVAVGPASAASLYLQAGREEADCLHADDLSELFLESGVPVGFLYLHDEARPDLMRQVFEVCVKRTTSQSVFAVRGIHASKAMRQLWHAMRRHERVGVTFDLYDLGILLFDRTKNKQDYIVNFVNYGFKR